MQLEKSLDTDPRSVRRGAWLEPVHCGAGVVRLKVRALGVGARRFFRMFLPAFLEGFCNAPAWLVTSRELGRVVLVARSTMRRPDPGHPLFVLFCRTASDAEGLGHL